VKALIFEDGSSCPTRTANIDNGINATVSFVIDGKNEVFSNLEWLESDYKFYVAKEAFPLSGSDKWISQHKSSFDYILTTQLSLAHACDRGFTNALYLPFATSWCKKLEDENSVDKDFALSFLPGSKFISVLPGHHVRKQIYTFLSEHKEGCLAEVQLFPPQDWVDRKEDVFDRFQFSIIVENYSSPGWFTEKFLDPFMRMTVPIYWGDPLIGNIFDPRGLLQFQTPNDLNAILKSITSETYDNMLPYIRKNHEISVNFSKCENKLHSFDTRMIRLSAEVIRNI
jgi:hypothetical protein